MDLMILNARARAFADTRRQRSRETLARWTAYGANHIRRRAEEKAEREAASAALVETRAQKKAPR